MAAPKHCPISQAHKLEVVIPTIADVARAAGVSTATVSRVLNGNTDVDPVLTLRVQTAAKKMAYRPSRIARSLRTRRTMVWALIISDIRNPFFTDMVRGVEDVAYENGYSLVLCNSEESVEKELNYLELALAESMAGVILAPASLTKTNLDGLMAQRIPVVTVDRKMKSDQVDSVLIDNRLGAEMAVSHLVLGGYRRIGCISGPVTVTTGADRLSGYRSGLRLNGLKPTVDLVRFGDFREESGMIGMRELLKLRKPIDSVFVANNLMTLGALEAIAETSRSIPDDIAVVGFDDMSWAPLLRPSLTTVAQPTYDLGAETARMLLSRIGGYAGSARELILAPTLRPRASSTSTSRVEERIGT